MPTPVSCLSGLVGLSRAASPCFPLPVALPPATNDFITASASGLYLDEVEGLHLRPAPNQPAGLEAWQRFDKARSQAIAYVENDLGKRMVLGQAVALKSGALGGPGNGMLLPVGAQAALTLPVQTRPGLAWELLSLSLSTDVTVTVPVYLDNVLLGSVATNGGVLAPAADTSWQIALDGAAHTLRAELPEGVRPKQNTLTCGCSNDWVRSVSSACACNVKMPAGGFTLQVREVCTAGKPLCYAIGQDDELRKSVSFALQYKTAEYVIAGLLADVQYSRYTSLDTKTLQALAERYTLLYDEHLTWLTSRDGLTRVQNPCYACAPSPYAYTKTR